MNLQTQSEQLARIFASNARGFEYHQARGLSPKAVKHNECETCKQAEVAPFHIRAINKVGGELEQNGQIRI